jgi:hypothetical protein
MTFAEIGCEQLRLIFRKALTVGSHRPLEPLIFLPTAFLII